MKKVAILGSTGSIGRNTLRVVANDPGRFEVVALTAGHNVDLLCEQIAAFAPKFVAVSDQAGAAQVKARFQGITVGVGEAGLCEAAAASGADIVLVAVVGAAGLVPTLMALDAGIDIALANKETLVVAGPLVIAKARERGCRLLPVDSEHSALFQCLDGRSPAEVANLVLTASGGPFRELPEEAMSAVTRDQALKHPTWQMGRKITIDSATLMNKGLEVIEAHFLFSMPPDRIKVVIHPQSIVHSMVELADGSMLAQLGVPDMRMPIQYALSYPERLIGDSPRMDLTRAFSMTFEPPSMKKFPCLGLAYESIAMGGAATAVLNAANEVVVEAFLEERIGFMDIPRTIELVLASVRGTSAASLGTILAADSEARVKAAELTRARRAAAE